MARIVWDYDHPRRAVWAAVLDADQWPLGFEGFEAAQGTVFHSGLFPTLTTGYSGWLECEVTEVKEFEHMTIRVVAPKNNVMTQTCWELSSDLHDSIGGGTRAVTNIYGVNPEDHDERVLLNIVGPLIRWVYGHANNQLDHPEREAPSHQTPLQKRQRRHDRGYNATTESA